MKFCPGRTTGFHGPSASDPVALTTPPTDKTGAVQAAGPLRRRDQARRAPDRDRGVDVHGARLRGHEHRCGRRGRWRRQGDALRPLQGQGRAVRRCPAAQDRPLWLPRTIPPRKPRPAPSRMSFSRSHAARSRARSRRKPSRSTASSWRSRRASRASPSSSTSRAGNAATPRSRHCSTASPRPGRSRSRTPTVAADLFLSLVIGRQTRMAMLGIETDPEQVDQRVQAAVKLFLDG